MEFRILDIDDHAKRKAHKIVNHAKKRVHWYNPSIPGWMSKIPGHDRRHQCKLNDFRCVFSYTVDSDNNRVVRHLSISVPSSGYPNPGVIKVIAGLFGFTGSDSLPNANYPEDWEFRIKRDGPIDDHCIVIGQDTGLRP